MMKFQKVVVENQMEIQKKEKALVEPILNKMKTVFAKVATEKHHTLVIEKQGQNVLYAQKDADRTDAVVISYERDSK